MTTTAPPTSTRLESLFRVLSRKQILSVVHAEDRKIALWVGAVSAGKTIASLIAFLFAVVAAPRGESIVIIGKTLQTIERNVINTLQNPRIFGALAAHTIHTTGSRQATVLGRVVDLIGANNAAAEERIRGGTFGLVYVDEATLLPPNFWAMLLTRLRVKGARMLATTNPGSRNHWLKVGYIDRADAVNMITFHLTMHDNPSYQEGGDPGPSYIRDMEATYSDPILHARMILGEWTAAEGAVYQDWDPNVGGRHVIRWEDMPPVSQILVEGMDWGTTNPSTGLMIGVTAETDRQGRPAPRLLLMDEWGYEPAKTGRRLTPEQLAADYASWWNGKGAGFHRAHTPYPTALQPVHRVVDPAAPAFRLALQNMGFQNDPAANDVLRGIGTVSNLISSIGPNGPMLIATDRCPGWNREITEYVWDVKKTEEGEDYPVTENDHYLDGGRYGIYSTRGIWQTLLQRTYGMAA